MTVFLGLAAALFLVWVACSIGFIIDSALKLADMKAAYKKEKRDGKSNGS